MKNPITKRNWPGWLIAAGLFSFAAFMTFLEVTPGPLAFLLGILLFIAIAGLAIGTATLLYRGVAGSIRWAKASDSRNQRIRRNIGISVGFLFALPFAYYWFAFLAMAGGFLSLAIQQRQMYH